MTRRECWGVAGAIGCTAVALALMAYPGGHLVLGAHIGIVLVGAVEGAVLAALLL